MLFIGCVPSNRQTGPSRTSLISPGPGSAGIGEVTSQNAGGSLRGGPMTTYGRCLPNPGLPPSAERIREICAAAALPGSRAGGLSADTGDIADATGGYRAVIVDACNPAHDAPANPPLCGS